MKPRQLSALLLCGAAILMLPLAGLAQGAVAPVAPAAPLPALPPAAAPPAPHTSPMAPAAPLAPAAPAPSPAEGRLYTSGPFDSIEISGAALVRFRQGAVDEVFVEGDDETQKSVEVEVRRGQLNLRPAGSWKFWSNRRLQVSITARDLRRVVISGAADLLAPGPVTVGALQVHISGAGLARFDQLKAEQLHFQVSGAGNGQMAGSVNQLGVQVAGRSEFRGEELMAQQASVRVSGIAEVKVWVLQNLNVIVSGVGTVDYWGSPNVQRHSSGIARINDRGPKRPLP